MAFARPENALSRANEFIAVGKHLIALETLYEVLKSRKNRTWTKMHQPIMQKYLELCVQLRRSDRAKDGLFQYRNICQLVNVNSLEEVMLNYLKLAEQKTDEARKTVQDAVLDVDDLEVLQTPSSVLKVALSGAPNEGKADRDMYAAWLKFLWESYKQCLDLLKNNNRVERQYKLFAQNAFKFTLKYNRKSEFRKLCDMVRQHMNLINRNINNIGFGVKLDNAESIQYHLDTRYTQFETATSLCLWQEAFKAVEDIHNLMMMSKKQQNPSHLANYYWMASLVFWNAGYYAYHASALFKHFILYKDQKKNVTTEDLTKYASKLVLATLSVPIYQTQTPFDTFLETEDIVTDREKRLYSLLRISRTPTRSSLLKDLNTLNILQYVTSSEIKNIFELLEVDFCPLTLKHHVKSFLNYLNDKQNEKLDLSQYAPRILDVSVTRILQQVSQVYRTISFERLHLLCPEISAIDLERKITQMAHTNVIEVRIDKRLKSLSFGTDLCAIPPESRDVGPCVQESPRDLLRSQLARLARMSKIIVNSINSKEAKAKLQHMRALIGKQYFETEFQTHGDVSKRLQIIEKFKELKEIASQKREKELSEARRIDESRLRAEEARRRTLEKEMREKEKEEENRKQNKLIEVMKIRETDFGQQRLANIADEELATMDPSKLREEEKIQKEKLWRKREEKLQAQAKKVDHFVRACHQEECVLLVDFIETYHKNREEQWKNAQEELVSNLIKEREHQIENRERLKRMITHMEKFKEKVMAVRKADLNKRLEEYEKLAAIKRAEKLEERKKQRKAERRAKAEAEKEKKRREEMLERQKKLEEERMLRLKRTEQSFLKQREVQSRIDKKIEEEERRLPQRPPPRRPPFSGRGPPKGSFAANSTNDDLTKISWRS